MLDILAQRKRIDEIAEQTPFHKVRNQLSAGTLAHLLDERKACKSQAELDEVAKEFGMDPEIVERIARHLNSPSISKIPLPTKDANDTPKQLVLRSLWDCLSTCPQYIRPDTFLTGTLDRPACLCAGAAETLRLRDRRRT